MTAKVCAIALRDARLALAYPLNFWMIWVGIAVTVFGFSVVSRLVPPSVHLGFGRTPGSYFDYVVVNVAFFSLQATALQSFPQAIRTDQLRGTLEAVLSTPTSIALIVLSSGIWAFGLTLLQIAWYFTIASLFFGLRLPHANPALVALFLLLIVTSGAPLGILSAAAIMRFKQVVPNFLVGSAASLLSGVLFPIALLPLPLRVLSWLLPITHGLNGMRAALHGAAWNTVAPDALWLCVASMLLLPASLAVFSRAVRRAMMDGTLADY